MPYKFYGGIHTDSLKKATADKAIKEVFVPRRVVIPLLQHTGSQAEPIVKVGDTVGVGFLIGRATGFISSSVHSSINGKVTRISYLPTPVFARVLSVTIEAEADVQDFKIIKQSNPNSFSKEELMNIIRDAGIVGLGGAAFPTHVKLSPPKGKPIDSVILNGAECEPYLTCDHRMMIENAVEILKGVEIIAKILDVKNIYVAIEDNKPLAIETMKKAVESKKVEKYESRKVEVVVLKTKYPQGAEKQIIKAVLNRVVPAGGLPMDVGCIVQNVGTAFAIYEAIYFGKPLIERVITITGPCVKWPTNIRVRIGTLLCDLVDSFGGFVKEPKKIIVGGPMMGVAQYTMDVPITKGTSGVVFLSTDEIDESEEGVCIRCGKCIEVCPMGLAPTSLMYNVKKEKSIDVERLGIMNCFECGACAYECPAKIPLLDYMKLGKAKVKG